MAAQPGQIHEGGDEDDPAYAGPPDQKTNDKPDDDHHFQRHTRSFRFPRARFRLIGASDLQIHMITLSARRVEALPGLDRKK